MNPLTDSEIEEVTALLRAGKPLPTYWRSRLFDLPKEYTIEYAAKEREEDILADTMAVPLQVAKVFGKAKPGEFTNLLVFGDNLQVLKTLWQEKQAGRLSNSDGTPGARLVYIDPPFGTGDEYAITDDVKAYSAKIQGSEFLEFLRKRLVLLRELLSVDGSIFIRIDYHFGHYVKALADEVFGPQNFRNEIVINRFKRQLRGLNSFNVATDSLFFYSRSGDLNFHEQLRKRLCSFCGQEKDPDWHHMVSPGLRNPPERVILGRKLLPPRGGHWKYTQDRIDEMEKAGRIRLDEKASFTDLKGNKVRGLPEFLQTEDTPVDSNWTDLKGYQLSSRYPTENPEELLERVIRSASNEGDLVIDAFAGSGTTAAVAEKLGRRWVAIDSGKLATYTMQHRLLTLKAGIGNKGRQLTPRPFVLANAGLYDYGEFKKLDWEQYRRFALQLFQCKDEPHTIAKLDLDGYFQGDDVMVFNYQKNPGVALDRAFIENLHDVLGERIGRRFFLIAPAASVRFLEDYIQLGPTRYYVLRIPYSIVDELHRVGFGTLKQPTAESEVNMAVDAVGFDFIQPPDVECTYTLEARPGQQRLGSDNNVAVVKIKTFQSNRLSKKPIDPDRNLLALVMADYSYDGDAFHLDEVFYGADISKSDWEMRFDASRVEGQMMLIFIDIFGNEWREVKRLDDFKKKSAVKARGNGNPR